MNSEELDQAKSRLEERLRQARSDNDRARYDLSQSIVAEVLGETTHQEIDEIRTRLVESQQELDGLPGALVALNGRIEQARREDRKKQDSEDAQAGRELYFNLRKRLIEQPEKSDRVGGELHACARRCDHAAMMAFIEKPNVSFTTETYELLSAAEEYSRRYTKSGQFEFTPMIHQ